MQKVFYRAAKVGEIEPGASKVVKVGEDECALFRTEQNEYYATGLLCPHQNEPLDRGHVEGYEVICRRHHLRFDIRTGDCTNAAGYSLRSLDVKLEGDDVLVGQWEDI